MNFGVVLIAFGGFLLGGAWSVWRGGQRGTERRTAPQVVFALILLVAALLATAAGILRLV